MEQMLYVADAMLVPTVGSLAWGGALMGGARYIYQQQGWKRVEYTMCGEGARSGPVRHPANAWSSLAYVLGGMPSMQAAVNGTVGEYAGARSFGTMRR